MPEVTQGVGRQRQREEGHRRIQRHRHHHQLRQQAHGEFLCPKFFLSCVHLDVLDPNIQCCLLFHC